MVVKLLSRLILERGSMPNSFTIGMGKLIRKARHNSGLSQVELAKKMFRRQASLSDMENGKMEPDASTLILLSYHLNTPVTSFFPDPFGKIIRNDDLGSLQEELLLISQKLDNDDLERLLVQLKALINR